ncbi:uncharacterized protein L201_005076 [Kwoniella dendrophila CBS 6074]|uniref:ubiquitinyl hydrolase 1 n=1 Tax=Kwoniella dendrophila CBS 6074 TaxID=1295534 RepID=A0AAX4JZ55_9TREE
MLILPTHPRTLDNNNLLSAMLDNPISFDKGIHRQTTHFQNKMTIVQPGPPSPPPTNKKQLPVMINGSIHNDNPVQQISNGFEKEDKPEEKEEEEEEEKVDSRVIVNGNSKGHDDEDLPSDSKIPKQLPTPKLSQEQQLNQPSPSISTPAKPPQQQQTQSATPRTPQTQQIPLTVSKIYQPTINPDDLYKKQIDLSWPKPISTLTRPSAGLHNPSMACYANATLQVLLHTPPVLRVAMEHQEDQCIRRSKNLFCMLCQLRDMATGSHWDKRRAYAPQVHARLKDIKKGFSKNRQEDTHEFFRFVTDALQATALAGKPKDLPEKIKHSSWVYKVWGGRVRSRVVCSRCNKPSDTFDWFLDLSLDVNKGRPQSISKMMNGFTREDKLEGDNKYHCDNCKAKANATKSFKIQEAPPILTLHLKRFSVEYSAHSGRARANKFNGPIEYSEYLDIAPYMVDPKVGGTNYRLFGVTCHRGVELRFGHYTSYIRGPQGSWFHADDDDVSPSNLRTVLGDRTAYLLSYIRIPDDAVPTPGSRKEVNGLSNGHTPTSSSVKIGEKRQRYDNGGDDDSTEGEENVNMLKPKKSINGFIGPRKPMVIRKGTPPSRSVNNHNDEDDLEVELPPELPPKRKFGSAMSPNKNHTSILQPKPIPPGQFYGKSPISRPLGPKPDYDDNDDILKNDPISSFSSSSNNNSNNRKMSKRDKKQLAKLNKKSKISGSNIRHNHDNPFKQSQLGGSNRSKQKDKQKWNKMQSKPPRKF